MAVIVVPIISLEYVTGNVEFTIFHGYSVHYTNAIGQIPVWNCQPNGYLAGGPWTFLGIDMHFGRMSFAQAKTLDMAWNWVAGRGLQFFLAWLAYHVFTSALMRTAEITHVPYGLFASLALYSGRPGCLWDIGKGLLTIRGMRIKFIMAWLLFSTIYLAAFPSLLDVMSGYEGAIRTELILPNTTMLDLTGVRTFEHILYFVPGCNYTGSMSCENYPLNYHFYDGVLNTSWYAFGHSAPTRFYTEEPGNYNCVAEQNLYEWGFSGEWVLLIISVNSFWVLGLWILWLDTEFNSQLTIAGRRMGTYRAIADISEAMREDLGPNLCGYPEKELAAAVKGRRPVKYYVEEGKEGKAGRIGLSSRKSEKVKVTWGREYG